jgi:hypothetical protein
MPVETETVLPCPKFGFCGSVDLIWYDRTMDKVVTDLKTRRTGLTSYESDEFQVDGYRLAYDLLNPASPSSRGSVLVVSDDGIWNEYPVRVPYGSFLRIKDVHDIVQSLGKAVSV